MTKMRNVPIREKVYIVLRDSVIDGILKPGERIIEDTLAAKYQVSRTPLREAIHNLEASGFLVRLASKGLIVAPMSVEEVEELYEIRSYLEGLATRVVTENLNSEQYRWLQEKKNNIEKALTNGFLPQAAAAALEIHDFVLSSCSHRVCVRYITQMKDQIARYRRKGIRWLEGRQHKSCLEHLDILECILARDGEAAEASMREHVAHSSQAIIRYIKSELNMESQPVF